MTRRVPAALAAALLAGAALLGTTMLGAMAGCGAAPAPDRATGSPGRHASEHFAPRPATPVDYTGILALSNCSGALVRVPDARADDPALALTNGHCSEYGPPRPGEVDVDRPSHRPFTMLDPSGKHSLGTLRADEILYSTMTDTDVTLYRLTKTYAQIESRYGVAALTLSIAHPADGTGIQVISGYWQRTWSCSIDAFPRELDEADWTWLDSVRYTSGCDVIDGTSGSPVIDPTTDRVVAINNTGNEDGKRCTLDNPCEVGRDGTVSIHPGIGYAQQTYILANCIGAGSAVDLDDPDCRLPAP